MFALSKGVNRRRLIHVALLTALAFTAGVVRAEAATARRYCSSPGCGVDTICSPNEECYYSMCDDLTCPAHNGLPIPCAYCWLVQ